MFREAEALSLPQPKIIEVWMRVRFIVYLAEIIEIETTVPLTAEVESWLKLRLKSQFTAKVLILLTRGEASKAEIAFGLGHKTVSGELHKQVRKLLEPDYIEMTIPDKTRSSKQRCRLTAKGKAFLSKEAKECEE